MVGSKYIIVTPCKNEEESLPLVAESIINQTITPLLWVIVDDNSTDSTPALISDLITKYDWIKSTTMEKKSIRDLGLHISEVYITGFNFAINFCLLHNMSFDYIGIVDSDMVLDNNYFERLIMEFDSDSSLGICSGHGYYYMNGKKVWPAFRDDYPTGSARLWNRKCFEKTGGYSITCSPDSVSIAKARVRGWSTKRIKNLHFQSTRPDSGADGLWNGYQQFAYNNYYTGYTFKHGFLKAIKLMLTYPYYTGIAYLLSFLESYIMKKERTNDEEVLLYYRKISDKRIKDFLSRK